MNNINRRNFLIGASSISLLTITGCDLRPDYSYLPRSLPESDYFQISPFSKWSDFIRREPAEQSVSGSGIFPIAMKEELWKVNGYWNTPSHLRYLAERDGKDEWKMFIKNEDRGPLKGDCEDFVLTKRHELRKLFPEYAHCFKFCIVKPRDGGGALYSATTESIDREWHAVLTVDTDDGTYVLDLYNAAPLNGGNSSFHWWYGLRLYDYIERESDQPGLWKKIHYTLKK